MNKIFSRTFDILFFVLCFFSSWVILGAIPYLQLEGMFRQVDTQVILLHSLGGILFFLKGVEIFLFKEKVKDLNNNFFLIPFILGILSILSAVINDFFYTSLLGSYQIGQGAFWYFDLSILVLCFSTLFHNKKLRYFFFINTLFLTALVTLFTLFPFWKGINISFFYFNDYLCYFGIVVFILFASLVKQKFFILVAYLFLGWFLSLLDNRAAIILWSFIILLVLFYHLLEFFRKKIIIEKFKNFIFSPKILTLSVFSISILILMSSMIFWSGDGPLPSNIGSSPLASLVVRGKLVEVILSDFFTLKNLIFGEGWGRTSDLLLRGMNVWQFDQLTVGFNLHFHTHNEIFEHFFSLGLPGLILFLVLIFFILKSTNQQSIYSSAGWLLLFYISCFWFFWAGTLPIFALALGSLRKNKNSFLKNNNIFDNVYYHNYIFSLIFFIVGLFLFFGAFLTFSHTKEYKKISYGALAEFSQNQNLNNIECKDYYNAIKGGSTVAPFMTSFPDFLKRNNIEYNQTYIKILQSLQCISEDIIFNSEPTLELLSSSILMDTKIFFSDSMAIKNLIDSEKKFEKLKEKVFVLAERAPKRGDLIMPFIAIAFKINRLEVADEICKNENIQGVEGYCNLIKGYQTLNKAYLSKSDINNSIRHINKALEYGILEEKIYGWWFFDGVRENLQNYAPSGIPVSPDIIYYISADEALKLLELLKSIN
ncbi:hypothetical protein OA100_00225 [Alphaproteobacteria bacterium]|nr:hypothetical protein [Alphaproteobacteria bacterium]